MCHVDRHGHFTLKQLRLPVVNETHTKSYTGPRLYDKTSILCHKLGSYCSCGDNLTRNNNTCVSLFPFERTAVVGVVDVE
jgi:hypothetical protein